MIQKTPLTLGERICLVIVCIFAAVFMLHVLIPMCVVFSMLLTLVWAFMASLLRTFVTHPMQTMAETSKFLVFMIVGMVVVFAVTIPMLSFTEAIRDLWMRHIHPIQTALIWLWKARYTGVKKQKSHTEIKKQETGWSQLLSMRKSQLLFLGGNIFSCPLLLEFVYGALSMQPEYVPEHIKNSVEDIKNILEDSFLELHKIYIDLFKQLLEFSTHRPIVEKELRTHSETVRIEREMAYYGRKGLEEDLEKEQKKDTPSFEKVNQLKLRLGRAKVKEKRLELLLEWKLAGKIYNKSDLELKQSGIEQTWNLQRKKVLESLILVGKQVGRKSKIIMEEKIEISGRWRGAYYMLAPGEKSEFERLLTQRIRDFILLELKNKRQFLNRFSSRSNSTIMRGKILKRFLESRGCPDLVDGSCPGMFDIEEYPEIFDTIMGQIQLADSIRKMRHVFRRFLGPMRAIGRSHTVHYLGAIFNFLNDCYTASYP